MYHQPGRISVYKKYGKWWVTANDSDLRAVIIDRFASSSHSFAIRRARLWLKYNKSPLAEDIRTGKIQREQSLRK